MQVVQTFWSMTQRGGPSHENNVKQKRHSWLLLLEYCKPYTILMEYHTPWLTSLPKCCIHGDLHNHNLSQPGHCIQGDFVLKWVVQGLMSTLVAN